MPAEPTLAFDDPRYVRALSHPLRVRILALLQEGTASPRELAPQVGATLGTTSYHVRELAKLGLVELVSTTKVRGAIAHHYKAAVAPPVPDERWATAAPATKQATIGAALQTVDGYARASAAAGGFDRAEARLTRRTLRLDDTGWEEAARAYDTLADELGRIEAAAVERLGDESGSDAGAVTMLFSGVRLRDS